jgi:deoxyribonuclease IV
MRIGFHVGIAGGLGKALERAAERGCETVQLFVSNPRGWRHTQPAPAAGESFRAGCADADVHPVFVHTIYLINLASASDEVYAKSLASLTDNLRAASLIGAEAVVTHLGSHGGAGEEAGLRRIVAALERTLKDTPGGPGILLETTAGAGNAMGSRFEHLGHIFKAFPREPRLGVCVDTCHVFAAGYEVRTRAGLKKTLAALDREVGLDRVRLVHANDSRGALGSQKDRHEHIGRGEIGLEGFRVLARDPFLGGLPWILETPQAALGADLDNLRALRSLRGRQA